MRLVKFLPPHDIFYISANPTVPQMSKWLKIKKIPAFGYWKSKSATE